MSASKGAEKLAFDCLQAVPKLSANAVKEGGGGGVRAQTTSVSAAQMNGGARTLLQEVCRFQGCSFLILEIYHPDCFPYLQVLLAADSTF